MIWSSMGWDTESDLFALSLASPIETNNGYPITRRRILAATSQLYDPLSILTPVIILGNIDRFHCHAIKKLIENHSVDKVKKL